MFAAPLVSMRSFARSLIFLLRTDRARKLACPLVSLEMACGRARRWRFFATREPTYTTLVPPAAHSNATALPQKRSSHHVQQHVRARHHSAQAVSARGMSVALQTPATSTASRISAQRSVIRAVCGRVAEKSHRFSIFSKGSVIAERPAAGELDAADYICCQKENSKDMQLCRNLKGAILLSTLRLRSPALFGRW